MSKFSVAVKNGLFRLVDAESGRIAVSERSGKPIDGGGHTDNQKAARQAGHLNDWWAKQQEKEAE